MPRFGPINRRNLIKYLRRFGFEGPYAGRRHQLMVKGDLKVILPNPHRGDIRKGLLVEILRQAGISKGEWEKLR